MAVDEKRDFTDFLLAVREAGGTPTREHFDRVWRALRRALCHEIRKRGLWEAWPGYFGVYGWSRFAEADPKAPGTPGGTADALDELTADCYRYVFVTRLQSLTAQLRIKPTVDGLVFLAIRSFLFERQKRHDPIGFRTFERLRQAGQQLVSHGLLQVQGGDARIRNDTILTFLPFGQAAPAASELLEQAIGPWAGGLVPEILNARGSGRTALLSRIERELMSLQTLGVEALRFGDVVEPVKRGVRAQWAALLSEEAAVAPASQEGVAPAQLDLLEAESLAGLDRCVQHALAELTAGETTRRELERLWDSLTALVTGSEGSDEPPPSLRSLARLTGVSRHRISQLLALLGEVVRECRASDGPTGR